ncbi:DUF2272 domain-containing protein [Luteimonas sp. SX5]|uniref:DUF2272 domain-containing protein n=1 Tax=Luteimonas galliterrae TaxID=2940486 RepID=A0ABT0MJT8_9GAMM|nr:DUF2272 domain-containing protein [Luteimonas galliterrae]MCL1635142.1 DUF2272 domain-containing protein [Luteimonas galliterrae]
MSKGRFGALVCAVAIPLAMAGCGSAPKKPLPPPPAPTAPKPKPQARAPLPPLNLSGSTAQRIVAVALREHAMWYQPFIDGNGRLASYRVSEAENALLADGTEAWQRVLGYWRNSGTLYEMSQSNIAGAYACQFPTGFAQGKAECRTFILDNAWSAAFVSYVMVQAGVPGFRASPRHYDYIRQAFHPETGGPYYYADPATQRADPGDLLCFVRGNGSVSGYEGLTARLNGAGGSLNTHCDIVVGRDRELRLVGGNVFNGVTMRKLKLDVQGRAILPRPVSATYEDGEAGSYASNCSPSNEAACDFNRQNWAVLLKLKPGFGSPTTATGVPAVMPRAPTALPPATNPMQPHAQPQPAQPQPAQPQPPQPQPAQPQPAQPQPAQPQPMQPQPAQPQPAQPQPVQPQPVQPQPVQPQPVQPQPVQPQPATTTPSTSQPAPVETVTQTSPATQAPPSPPGVL